MTNKENNGVENSALEIKKSSDSSQSFKDFNISTTTYKSSPNQVNLLFGILGIVFAIAVIYFSFRKEAISNEVPKDIIKVTHEQNKQNKSSNNEKLNNDIVQQNGNPTNSNNTIHNSSNFTGNFPQASERLLTSAELIGLSKQDLKIMRNEIFARHGYIFKTTEMKSHFVNQTWYRGQYDDVTSYLSEIEKQNIELIKKYE